MARVALMRSGTVLYADNAKASPVAGNQDALGVLRYLKQSGHDVCIFGPSIGDFGVPTFSPNFSGLSITAGKDGGPCHRPPADEYDFRINIALAELRQWRPQVCINVAGQQPSHSNPGNPWGCKPLYTAISTNYPMLKAVEDLKLPRIVILNDPRNLPREHEGHYMWNTLPVAVLSQRDKATHWATRGKQMYRKEVYAACENWWSYGMPYADLDEPRSGIVVIAHSHAQDGRVKGDKRAVVWDRLLSKCRDPFAVYGHGWEHQCPSLPGLDSPWKGLLKHDQVQSILRSATCGPMISLEPDFATGKLREYVVAGAMPRPVNCEHFTYDYNARYVPLDHPTRLRPSEVWGDAYDRGWVEELRVKTTPNFDPLEDVINKVVNGQEHIWGGYKWVA